MLFFIKDTVPKDKTTALFIIGVVVGIGIYVFFFNPLDGFFYPPCWFHELTGLYCAGCGITRASHSLLNGEISKAIDYNVLLPLFLMVILFWIVKIGGIFFVSKTITITHKPKWLYWLIVGVVALFFVLRNIPHPHLLWLAP
jgi:hypothetical protein